MSRRIECIVPILRVNDLAASLRFYLDVLGFKRDWGGEPPTSEMAGISRDGWGLMLCDRAQGNPGTWVWIGVHDAIALHEQLKSAGAKIILPPTNFYWAMEFRVEDPDGHILRFGSEPDSAQPFVNPR
jgi:predicted enzyme related to lactoylglutathione lyase